MACIVDGGREACGEANLAIDAAQGRLLAFLDADDLWLPQKLALSIEWITAFDYTVIYHDYRHMSRSKRAPKSEDKAPPSKSARMV